VRATDRELQTNGFPSVVMGDEPISEPQPSLSRSVGIGSSALVGVAIVRRMGFRNTYACDSERESRSVTAAVCTRRRGDIIDPAVDTIEVQ
jgi:hypothetical protein